jgi:ClpP class serine protease
MNDISHSLLKLSSTVYNSPQLITEDSFAPILDYLSLRNSGLIDMRTETTKVEPRKPSMVKTVGEIQVTGALTYKPVSMMCSEGGTSYQQLIEDTEQLISQGVKTIVYTHSSGGGQALHCFSTANRLRQLADENGVTTVTYIDEMSASAALALGIQSDHVIIHPEAKTGSIGCVCAILDKSKALADAGLKPIYISSTAGKTPYAADGSFSQSFLDNLQAEVTELGNQFAAHVEKYTNIPVEKVLSLDAQMFSATRAKELGLVTAVMNHQEFAEFLANL